MSGPAIPYVGSRISLISKSGIRYEGLLYNIDKDSTVALQNVRSFGTEGRRKDGEIPPSNNLYDYIIFRGTDIKALKVCEPPPMTPMHQHPPPPNDPAIINVAMNQQMPMGYPPHMHPGLYPYYNSPYSMYPPYYGYGSQPQQGQGQPGQGQGQQSQGQQGQNRALNAQTQQPTEQARRTGAHQYNPQASNSSEPLAQKTEDTAPEQESSQADETSNSPKADETNEINHESTESASPQGAIQETVSEQSNDFGAKTNGERNRAYPYASSARQPLSGDNRGQKPRNGNNRGPANNSNTSNQTQHQQPRQNIQQQGGDRRQGGQSNQGGQQARRPPARGGAPTRYNNNRAPNGSASVQLDEFDFEKANSLFDKDKLKQEILKAAEDNSAETSPAAQALLATKSYDKTSSFFDSLSCEATDKLAEEANDRRTYAEQRRLNAETFGVGNVKGGRGGHHGGGRSNYAPRRPNGGQQQQQQHQQHNATMQANRQQAKRIFVPAQQAGSNKASGEAPSHPRGH